uniref:Uncharacterized protein n=1 Tax=Ralstonia solanacearum TaxID=305 RepID=A0A0S4TZG1_RALSL|nr:protein of unknown function [Ralstonia solanacearum]
MAGKRNPGAIHAMRLDGVPPRFAVGRWRPKRGPTHDRGVVTLRRCLLRVRIECDRVSGQLLGASQRPSPLSASTISRHMSPASARRDWRRVAAPREPKRFDGTINETSRSDVTRRASTSRRIPPLH